MLVHHCCNRRFRHRRHLLCRRMPLWARARTREEVSGGNDGLPIDLCQAKPDGESLQLEVVVVALSP